MTALREDRTERPALPAIRTSETDQEHMRFLALVAAHLQRRYRHHTAKTEALE